VADAVEAGRQDMDQEAADELRRVEAHNLHPVTTLDPIVFPAEGHGDAIGADQAVVRDGDAVGIAAEIGQHGFGPAEGWLGIDDPVGFAQRREVGREVIRVCQSHQIAEKAQLADPVQPHQSFEEQAAEQSRQDFDWQKEPRAATYPAGAIR